MIYQSIKKCRISKKKDLVSVGNFRKMPLTGVFPKNKNHKVLNLPFERSLSIILRIKLVVFLDDFIASRNINLAAIYC